MHPERGILLAGNWKMNLTPNEARRFFGDWKELISPATRAVVSSGKLQLCLFPTAVSLTAALEEAAKLKLDAPLEIGAQNAHWEKKGAFTGETSGPMLQELGIHWVLVGHSERRQSFGETDQTVNQRAQSLRDQGFNVILCIGETKDERQGGKTQSVLDRQLLAALPALKKGVVIAYEPVWAIGTGLTASPEQAEEAHQMIREFLKTHAGAEIAQKTSILYGGSVTPENLGTLLKCPNIDGALVGGASLKPDSWNRLCEIAASQF